MRKWGVPKIWADGECWIIGGGPSLLKEFNIPADVVQSVRKKEKPLSAYSPYLSFLHTKHVIGVNAAFMLGDWVDVLFFGDFGFFEKHRNQIAQFPGIKVTCHKRFKMKEFARDGIKYMPRDGDKPVGISVKPGHVAWNKNSGASAISMAVQMGVKRIYLLGFDMKIEGNQQHFHNVYRSADKGYNKKQQVFARHLKGFPAIKHDADKLGVEIVNVNPESRITQFPRKSLKEVMK